MTRILTTHHYPQRAVWASRVDAIDRKSMPIPELWLRVVQAAPRYEAVVLNGSVGARAGYVDLFAAAAIARRRSSPAVVLTDCSWKLGDWWLDRAACRAGIRLLDSPRVTYCVRSSEEVKLFPRQWDVDPERVVLTRYGHKTGEDELAAPVSHGGGVFAGGNTLRDYETLIEVARDLPAEVTIATSLFSSERPGLPSNVRVVAVHRHEQFMELMRHATVVLVPFRAGIRRMAGADTFLQAMAMGKLVLVTEGPGVRDYIEDRRTGLIVPPEDSSALAEALRWALDPAHAHEVNQIRSGAKHLARTSLTFDNYLEELLAVVEEAVRRKTREQP